MKKKHEKLHTNYWEFLCIDMYTEGFRFRVYMLAIPYHDTVSGVLLIRDGEVSPQVEVVTVIPTYPD